MNAQTTGVLAVMEELALRREPFDDAMAAAQKYEEAIATVEGLINALSVLADAAEARGIPVDAARAALTKANGEQA